MAQGPPFSISFDPAVKLHLRTIEKQYHRMLQNDIHGLLSHEPDIQTRNRKPLKHSERFGALVWELRTGPQNRFRVFYAVNSSERSIYVRAIGVKERNRLYIAGEEVTL